jgi:hypothetical protein
VALAPLATVTDLDNRGIDITDTALVQSLLASASAAVRDAAGVAISEVTATITLPTPVGRRLHLPSPVRTITAVLLDGGAITDWKLRGDSLWRSSWQHQGDIPGEVTVTFTFGLPDVPEDIVDLVCNIVGAGVAHAAEGYEAKTGKTQERIDDYSVGYTQGDEAVVSPMELPDRTRRMLARRFGGGAAMVGTRS